MIAYNNGYVSNSQNFLRSIHNHYQEWVESAIAPDLIEDNLVSVEGMAVYQLLFTSSDIPRTNTGAVTKRFFETYKHCLEGGWYPKNQDPKDGGEMEWVQFKPDFPRDDLKKKNKKVKYEPSPKQPSRIFSPLVNETRWGAIVKKHYPNYSDDKIKSIVSEYSNFWQWVIDNPSLPIVITEGSKKTLSLLSQNIIALGLPGVTMGFRKINGKRIIQDDLKLFCKPNRVFNIAFDADTKRTTIRDVRKAIFCLGATLQQEKCRVNILSWLPELGKGIDDVLFNADNPSKVLADIFANRMGFSYWVVEHQFKLSKVSLTINSRWCNEAVKELPRHRLIGLKASHNTGKTELIVKRIEENLNNGLPCFVLTHLESLAKALSVRFGVPYRTENDPTRNYYGFSLCIDSFYPKKDGINPDNWTEICLIVDESEQVLTHAFCGQTAIADFRPTVFRTLWDMREKIVECIIADADLSDVSINFFEKLLDTPAYIIENTYKFEGMEFFQYKTANDLLGYGEDCLARGERLFIATSSQKPKSKHGTIALENYLSKKYPELKILRIDSETTNDPTHQAYKCLGNLNTLLLLYDVVICSPSLCTGVSVDVFNHFNKVIAFSMGNISPHSFLQIMWRLRDKVERHFYCPKTGNSYVGNGSCSSIDVLASNQKIANYAVHSLGLIDSQLRLDDYDGIFIETWAKIASRTNASSRCYQELLIDLIKSQGHTVYGGDDDLGADFDEVKENAKYCQDNRNEHILSRPDIDDDQAEKLEKIKKVKGHTLDDICTSRKHKVKKAYGDVTKEILEFDDDGNYGKLKLFYYLTLGNVFLKRKDVKTAQEMASNNSNSLTSFDVGNRVLTPKITALKAINVLEIVEYCLDQGSVRNDDPKLTEINKILNVSSNAKEFRAVGITISKNVVSTINSLLRQIGFKLKCLGVIRDGDDTFREYHLEVLPNFSFDILLNWFERDKRQNKDIAMDSSVTNFPIYILEKLLRITKSENQNPQNNKNNVGVGV
ncbi:plasmid replication protein, CyRepA1 family [Geminocystis sp. NIES-3709]|uniref:plasmid replication protein, CyRepA1 family n=1 Tax=Geminocystis sp. NIES-3709 TaxID=1617448 RepID=UPI0005FC832D|nr:plasmid replication protein, CyRepA1 family [Geminocystis sp. NIES-3709]BAQ67112.1 DNA primase [Geminocystis sp. NIES-3709]